MAKKKNVNLEENVMEETVVENTTEETVVEEVVEETPILIGIVSNCAQLNVRKKPTKNSDVVCVLNRNDQVSIGESKSDKWLKVTTKDGKEGFCMKEYIKIK